MDKYLIEDPLLESWRNGTGASDPDPRKKTTAKVLIRLAISPVHVFRGKLCAVEVLHGQQSSYLDRGRAELPLG
jgi:hypothetical protein